MDITPGKIFDLGLLNPNPTFRKTKDGPIYRISFEVTKETWDTFAAANTQGMIVAAKAMVTQSGEFEAAPNLDGGGEIARQLKASGFFRVREVAEVLAREEDYRAWVRKQPCAICGEYDYDQDTGKAQAQYAHINRIAEGSGRAIKSPWLGIPLCDRHHRGQHQHGDGWLVAQNKELGRKKDATDDPLLTLAVWYRERFAWNMFKEGQGIFSMRELTKERIRQFANANDLMKYLPKELKSGQNEGHEDSSE